ncbi:uncharacterized protein EI90DRAFT_3287786 [Cantharellus anzutake]|uniref:uncharacterized protein n=1 Tax=Cantharellus anzutake TaxID=1750568 RepID=UPI00190590C1|nr:uncharacterized protein EI90DRAFT_3287786 [Cantharellus anzutake]KAF8335896.1 hypothetical protein EI90DRAFT_3287786 [Cantharellus anzutake]
MHELQRHIELDGRCVCFLFNPLYDRFGENTKERTIQACTGAIESMLLAGVTSRAVMSVVPAKCNLVSASSAPGQPSFDPVIAFAIEDLQFGSPNHGNPSHISSYGVLPIASLCPIFISLNLSCLAIGIKENYRKDARVYFLFAGITTSSFGSAKKLKLLSNLQDYCARWNWVFSRHSDIHDEDQLAAQFTGFLLQFLEVFIELKGKNFYLSGESYGAAWCNNIQSPHIFSFSNINPAGFYVPYIANYLYENPGLVPLNTKGIWITDPSVSWDIPAYNLIR